MLTYLWGPKRKINSGYEAIYTIGILPISARAIDGLLYDHTNKASRDKLGGLRLGVSEY